MSMEVDAVISPVARKYLRLQRARNVGPVCTRKLIEHFGSIDAVFEASMQALERVEDVGRYRAEAVFRARNDETADGEIGRAAEHGVHIICCEDEEYPKLLQHIPDPPVCLYVRGQLRDEDGLAIALVGSRRCSRHGLEQAERFGGVLAQAGFTVVSGMARGADAAGHRGALAGGGRTIAVQGCGLGHLYPPEHAGLAGEIERKGALVSELPIDAPPEGNNFPPRNRIIVGMSLGVLVVEAGKRSGALISARLASEYNREAFAIPGLLTNPAAHGTNALIRDGSAKLVTCLDDILDELGEAGRLMRGASADAEGADDSAAQAVVRLDPSEEAVLKIVTSEETPLESICQDSGLSAAAVASTLTKLQMKGIVVQLPGNFFARRTRRERPAT